MFPYQRQPAKRICLREGSITVYPIIYREQEDTQNLRVGEIYKLAEETCEGVEMPVSIYECKHIIKEYGGVQLNSVVMKQLEGISDMIFSLTKADCKSIGIDYEPRLQLFPLNFNWEKCTNIRTNKIFTPDDMGSYPPSPKDGAIHQMHVAIKFKYYFEGLIPAIVTTMGNVITLNHILNGVNFRFRVPYLQRRYPIVHKILAQDDKNTLINQADNTISFMLFFGGATGIDPHEFDGKNIDELIEVSYIKPLENIKSDRTSSSPWDKDLDPWQRDRINWLNSLSNLTDEFEDCFRNNNHSSIDDSYIDWRF